MKKFWQLLIIFQLFLSFPVFTQQNVKLNNTTTKSDKYIVHKVAKKETIYSICIKYNLDENELVTANPQLANGLKTGETLNIPIATSDKTQKTAEKKIDEFIFHIVKKGETPYSLSKLYDITIETIIKYNPEAKNGVNESQSIRIPNPKYTPNKEEQKSEKKETIEKVNLTIHEVEEGETFYSIQQQYGISEDELKELNPQLKDGLKVGQSIKLPSSKIKNPKQQDNKIEHIVEPGETMYSLCAKFNVTKQDITELNPALNERYPISGETIFIPKNNNISYTAATPKAQLTSNGEEKSKEKPAIFSKKDLPDLSSDTFRITMFLPLFLRQNDSINTISINSDEITQPDSTENQGSNNSQTFLANKSERTLYNNTRNFLSFYEGFLVALDTMKKTGINIRLDLFDNQSSQRIIDSVIRHTDVVNTDLIVGPVDVKHQKNISNFSNKNQIPLVSPFSNDDDYSLINPYYFQINPTKDYILRKTADFIGRDYCDKNVIVMVPDSYEQIKGADMVETIREKMKYYASKKNITQVHFTKVSISDVADQEYWTIKNNLDPAKENVVFIPLSSNRSQRESNLSKAINSLYVLSEEFPITLIGTSEFTTAFKSINIEYFHKLNLHFLTPNFIDYQDNEVKQFILNYRSNFLTEPNQYSYRGYDIAKFYLEAYRQYGRNFINKISSIQTNTLQSNFKPKRLKELSGFMNNSLFVTNFTTSYEVKAVPFTE